MKGDTAVVRGSAYKSYRFKVEAMKGTGQNAMQFSDLVFYCGTENVTRPYADVSWTTEKDGGGSPFGRANETPDAVFDGDFTTKWCDKRGADNASSADRGRLWVRIDYAEPKMVTSYSWYTANDFENRDPAAWRLQGSNDDGSTWTDIDVRSGFYAPANRMACAGIFGASGSFGKSSHVVVELGATLRVIGSVVPASAVENKGGTVELADGVTLVSDGGYLNGDISGTGSVNVTGGCTSLAGAQSYTGATHVEAGTLNIGVATNYAERASFSGKYFRLTIKRASNNGASIVQKDGKETVNDRGATQASEFQLYDAEGKNVAQGLKKAPDGTPATLLAAGTFAPAATYTFGIAVEGTEKLFDGDTSTIAPAINQVDSAA